MKQRIFKIFLIFIYSIVICILLLGLYTFATRQRIGADCGDGWSSSSIGRGTCSHHNGVVHWEYKYWYNKDKIFWKVSNNPLTGESCDYGYNFRTETCCDDDDYSCEVYDKAPKGATAFCEDGTYGFVKERSDTCFEHGGVNNDPQFSPYASN